MISVQQSVKDPKYFYKRWPKTSLIEVAIDGPVSIKAELSVAEAKSLRDQLVDLIDWITEGEEQPNEPI